MPPPQKRCDLGVRLPPRAPASAHAPPAGNTSHIRDTAPPGNACRRSGTLKTTQCEQASFNRRAPSRRIKPTINPGGRSARRDHADLAEPADARGSGPRAREGVGVRPPRSARGVAWRTPDPGRKGDAPHVRQRRRGRERTQRMTATDGRGEAVHHRQPRGRRKAALLAVPAGTPARVGTPERAGKRQEPGLPTSLGRITRRSRTVAPAPGRRDPRPVAHRAARRFESNAIPTNREDPSGGAATPAGQLLIPRGPDPAAPAREGQGPHRTQASVRTVGVFISAGPRTSVRICSQHGPLGPTPRRSRCDWPAPEDAGAESYRPAGRPAWRQVRKPEGPRRPARRPGSASAWKTRHGDQDPTGDQAVQDRSGRPVSDRR